eukprot:gene6230-10236_t
MAMGNHITKPLKTQEILILGLAKSGRQTLFHNFMFSSNHPLAELEKSIFSHRIIKCIYRETINFCALFETQPDVFIENIEKLMENDEEKLYQKFSKIDIFHSTVPLTGIYDTQLKGSNLKVEVISGRLKDRKKIWPLRMPNKDLFIYVGFRQEIFESMANINHLKVDLNSFEMFVNDNSFKSPNCSCFHND